MSQTVAVVKTLLVASIATRPVVVGMESRPRDGHWVPVWWLAMDQYGGGTMGENVGSYEYQWENPKADVDGLDLVS